MPQNLAIFDLYSGTGSLNSTQTFLQKRTPSLCCAVTECIVLDSLKHHLRGTHCPSLFPPVPE